MKYIQTILKGIGQVMFQNNSYSGLLFLIGIMYHSWLLGIAALLGGLISTATAQILKYAQEDIENGLYGFNGTLVGIAVLFFFDVHFITVSALVLGAVLSTIVMGFLKKIMPPFTAPFVLITWLVLGLLLFVLKFPLLSSGGSPVSDLSMLPAVGNSFGQVMFQENVITGLFFILAIVVNNRIMAIYALYAAFVGSLTGWFITGSAATANAGLMGYNAILCAIALTGTRRSDFLWISIAVILSVIINIAMAQMRIITLTAPFVLTTWLVLTVKRNKNLVKKKNLV